MQYVDVCIGNEEDAELCLGFKPDADIEGGKTDAEGYKGIFTAMAKEFGFKYVISTLRESFSATHNGWKAMIYNGEEFYTSKRYDIDPIIDRVAENDSRKVEITYLNPNSLAIAVKIPLYPSASVLPPSISASGLNPKQSSASSSFPIHTSTYCINGRIMD
jgi:hypothetical protein